MIENKIVITPAEILEVIIKDGSEDSFRASIRGLIIAKLALTHEQQENFKLPEELKTELNKLYCILDPLRGDAVKTTIKTEIGKTGEVDIYPFSEENKDRLLESGFIRSIKDKIQSVIYNIAEWLHESWLGQNFVPFGNQCGKVENWACYGAAREEMKKVVPQLEALRVA